MTEQTVLYLQFILDYKSHFPLLNYFLKMTFFFKTMQAELCFFLKFYRNYIEYY